PISTHNARGPFGAGAGTIGDAGGAANHFVGLDYSTVMSYGPPPGAHQQQPGVMG
ncbi:hypothetical protein HK097_001673, partial [Rhizophlyctis rosea]